MKACKFTGAVAAALLGFGLAGAAHGGEGDEGLPKGVYVGASIGHGIFKFWDDETDRCAASGLCRTDNNGTMYSVYGGFELSPHVAIEVGWIGHEALEIEYNPGSCRDGSTFHREVSVSSIYAVAVGRPPMDTGRIRPFGKAGVYRWKAEDETTCSSGDFAATGKDDDAALLVGAGADIELTERTSLRAEWLYFAESGGKAHAFLGGLNFRF